MECSGGEFAKVSCAPLWTQLQCLKSEYILTRMPGVILHRRRWI